MKIKTLRESKNLTQMDVAEALQVSRTTVAMWETNKSVPRAQLLPRLAQLFSCTVDELLTDTVETAEGA